ncbi:MAG: DUF1877 family protein [Bacteroidota bacterium]
MGQVGWLQRISKETFVEIEKEKRFPQGEEVLEMVDVDKLWEHIMFTFGGGKLGLEPTVYLFMPTEMIVTYEDQYMKEGIRYHTSDKVKELYQFMSSKSTDDWIAATDMDEINRKAAYTLDGDYILEMKSYMNSIVEMFKRASDNDEIIIGRAGY